MGEAADAILDGIAIVQVYTLQQGATFHCRLLQGWSIAPSIEVIFETFSLSGLMVLCLVMSIFMQASFCLLPGCTGKYLAEIAGLGATKKWALGEAETASRMVGLARVVYEICPQLALQTTAVKTTGTPLRDQPILFCSIAASACLGLQKVVGFMKGVCQGKFRQDQEDDMSGKIIFGSFGCVGLAAIIWTIIRVGRSQYCDSLIYGVTSGCVHVNYCKCAAIHQQ